MSERISPRKFWNAIKSILPTRSKSSSHKSSDMKKRVNEFGNYFANIVSKMKLAAFPFINFVWRYHKKEPLRKKSTFTFSFVSTAFVKRGLHKLKRNKASGTDSLLPNLLKDCASVIKNPISHIINLSLKSGRCLLLGSLLK